MQTGIMQGGNVRAAHTLHLRARIGNGGRTLAHLPCHLQPVMGTDVVACLCRLFGALQQTAFHGGQALPGARVVRVQVRSIAKIHQRAIAVFAEPSAAQVFFASAIERQYTLRGFHFALQGTHLGVLWCEGERDNGHFARLLQRIVLTLGLLDQRRATFEQPAACLLQAATAGDILATGTLLNRQIQRNCIVGIAIQAVFLQCLFGALAHLRQRLIAQLHRGRLPLRHGLGGLFAPMETFGLLGAAAAGAGCGATAGAGVGVREQAHTLRAANNT